MLIENVMDTIGGTPLLRCSKLELKYKLKANIYAKLEMFNPGGSIKDRPVYNMILHAIQDGIIKEGGAIIEATSGNTGIALAMCSAALGLQCIIVMPESMSIERRKLITQYGAQLVLTPAKLGMKGAIAKAEEINQDTPNSMILSQFTNPNNPLIHMHTTGVEIAHDLNNKVDILVAGVGTGGTISGIAEALKNLNIQTHIVAVEPRESSVLSKNSAGPHKIQGIGAGFVPENCNIQLIDEIMTASYQEAIESSRIFAKTQGVLAGISAGAALHVAMKMAIKAENENKNIVVVIPDTGERYISDELFEYKNEK